MSTRNVMVIVVRDFVLAFAGGALLSRVLPVPWWVDGGWAGIGILLLVRSCMREPA